MYNVGCLKKIIACDGIFRKLLTYIENIVYQVVWFNCMLIHLKSSEERPSKSPSHIDECLLRCHSNCRATTMRSHSLATSLLYRE